MFMQLGLNPELTATLGRLLFVQAATICMVSMYRYEVKRREFEIRRAVARHYSHL